MAETNADRRERVEELVRLGRADPAALADHVSELEGYLGADSAYVRRRTARAVVLLAEANPESVVPLVDRLAEGLSDEAVRANAADALGSVAEADPGAVMDTLAALVAALDGGDDVRVPASGALAALASNDAESLTQPGILDRLFRLLSDERPAVRSNAAAALSEIAAADAGAVCEGADDLRARLDDNAATVRRDVAVALGTAASACPAAVVAAVPDFVALLEDPDESVRAGAAFALSHSTQAEGSRQQTVDVLLDAVDNDVASVRQHATFALASLASEDPDAVRPAVGALARRLVDEDDAVRQNARSALATLEADYQAVVTEARAEIQAGLEEIDDTTETIPFTAAELRGLAGDPDVSGEQQAAADHALTLLESGTVASAPDTSTTGTTGQEEDSTGESTGGADASETDTPDTDDDGPRFCPNCGETLEEDGEFCPICGTAVE